LSQDTKKTPQKSDKVDDWLNAGIHTLLTMSLIMLGGALIYRYFEIRSQKHLAQEEPCLVSTEDQVMRKPYLRGLLEEREEYRLGIFEEGCGEFGVGDIVAYRPASTSAPILRVVRAVPGHVLELRPSVNGKAWSLMVNGSFVKDHRGEVYYFGSYPVAPPIGLYIKNNGKMLMDGHYLLFSTVSPGVNDSGQFGVVVRQSMIGKVIGFN